MNWQTWQYPRFFILLVILLLFLCRLPMLKTAPNLYDEGYLVQGAVRWLHGQRPGVHFHAYAPARYAIIASTFQIAGKKLLAERVLLAFVSVGFGLGIAMILREYAPLFFVLPPLIFYSLCPGPWHKVFLPLSLLIFAIIWRRTWDLDRVRRSVWLGFAAALALYLRIEGGVIALCWALLFTFISEWLQGTSQAILLPRFVRFKNGVYSSVILGFAWLLVSFALWAATYGFQNLPGAIVFYAKEIGYALQGEFLNPHATSLPSLIEAISDLTKGFELPAATYSLALFVLTIFVFLVKKSSSIEYHLQWVLSFSAFIILFGFFLSAGQQDASHLVQALNLCFVPLGIFVAALWRWTFSSMSNWGAYWRQGLAVFWCCLFIFYGMAVIDNKFSVYYTGSPLAWFQAEKQVDIPDQGHWRIERNDAPTFRRLAELDKIITPDKTLAVMPSGPLFNFLLNARNPLPTDLFQPHTILPQDRFENLKHALKGNPPDFILLSEVELFASPDIPASRQFVHYARELIRLISSQYHLRSYIPGWILLEHGYDPSTERLFQWAKAVSEGYPKDHSDIIRALFSNQKLNMIK